MAFKMIHFLFHTAHRFHAEFIKMLYILTLFAFCIFCRGRSSSRSSVNDNDNSIDRRVSLYVETERVGYVCYVDLSTRQCTLPRSRVEREERGSSAGIQSMMSSTFQSIMRCNRNEKEKEKTQLNGVSLNRIQSEVTAC